MCGNQSYIKLLENNFNPYNNKEETKQQQISPVKPNTIDLHQKYDPYYYQQQQTKQEMPELTDLIQYQPKQSLPTTSTQTSGSTIDRSLVHSQLSGTSTSKKSELGNCQQS
eukprot:TRINITY_DN16503_c0_g1_i1.p4 TRINITY_DN16503_c0_g1~~TRINITY_DN16503_c0_g1_i1.p4  ORF type:complete len:111 (-),score=19.28 TRINITY_DN16503_c0_g1_i1:332-664(-)